MADRSVKVILSAVIDDFRRNMGEARKSVQGVGDAAQDTEKKSSKLGDAARGLGKAALTGLAVATTATAGLGLAALKTGVQYNTLEQTSRAAFTTILGSADAANQMMDQIREFAKTSPFPRDVFIEATRQMLGFGFAAEEIIPTLAIIQDAVAAMGGSASDITLLVDVFSKIQSTGRVMADDLNRLSSVGINAWQILAEAAGKSIDDVRVSVSQGAVDSEFAITALTEGMQARFGGAAENIKATMVGALDRIKGAFRDIGSIIAAPFVDPQGGGAAVDWANALADAMRALEAVLGPVVAELAQRAGPAFDKVTDALERAAEAMRNADIDSVTASLERFSPAIAGLGAAGAVAAGGMLPFISRFTTMLGPHGALIAGISAFVLASPDARDLLKELLEALEPLLPIVGELAAELIPLLTSAVEGLVLILGPVPDIVGAIVDSIIWWNEKLEDLAGGASETRREMEFWENPATWLDNKLRELGGSSEIAATGVGKFGRSAQDGRKGVEEAAPAVEEFEGALANSGAAAEEAKEKLDQYLDLVKRTTDPVYAVVAALDDVETAQSEYNEAVDEFGPKSKQAEDAALKLSKAVDAAEQAAIDGDLSYKDFKARLKSWVEQGVLTAEQAKAIERRVDKAREAAKKYKGNYKASLTLKGYDDVRAKLRKLQSAIINLPSGKTIRISAQASVGSVGSGAGVFQAQGGPVNGPGTATSDSIPAWLSNGEYVMKAASVAKYGTAMMDLINAGRFAGGGPIGNLATIKASSNIDPTDWKDFAGQAAISQAQQIFKAGLAAGQSSKVLPPGSYRIGRGPAGHGYNARDLPAPTGTPVFAAAAGIVSRAARLATSYGIHAAINHGNWRTLYAHMSQMFVRAGQRVGAGQPIGRVGSTGNSTGPHLHLEPDLARLYDQGGILKPGTLGGNASTKPEAVLTDRQWNTMHSLASGGAAKNAQVEIRITGAGAQAEAFKASTRKGEIQIFVDGKRAEVR